MYEQINEVIKKFSSKKKFVWWFYQIIKMLSKMIIDIVKLWCYMIHKNNTKFPKSIKKRDKSVMLGESICWSKTKVIYQSLSIYSLDKQVFLFKKFKISHAHGKFCRKKTYIFIYCLEVNLS